MDFLDLAKLSEMATTYLPQVLGALLTLVIGFWITGRAAHLLRLAMERNKMEASVVRFLSSLVAVGLKILVLLSVARMFGIETTSFVAIFTALAFAVGTALQGGLAHFASGVLILVFKPYKVGDLVTIGGGQTGTVKEIQVFNTVLQTLDNKHIIIPNAVVTSNIITNISGQGIIGVEFSFPISYKANIDKAREVILDVAKNCPYILDEPGYGVVVAKWADSSVVLASRPFCKSGDYWNTFFYMNEHVKKAFDQAGVEIPYNQMDVHVHQAG
jgi:small conductance mechanosensitive channel